MNEEARKRWVANAVASPSFSAVSPDIEGHWTDGFTPSNEIEAFMGRRVHPVEEATIRVRIARDLEIESND